MATTATNFNSLPQVIKGNIGESIVDALLLEWGEVLYKPISDIAHPFDRLCVGKNRFFYIAEVKTKPARRIYPDTGIDIRHYISYKAAWQAQNLDTFLFFVDDGKNEIYGNWLSDLERKITVLHGGKALEYPLIQQNIIYFPLVLMKHIYKLKQEEIQKLKDLNP